MKAPRDQAGCICLICMIDMHIRGSSEEELIANLRAVPFRFLEGELRKSSRAAGLLGSNCRYDLARVHGLVKIHRPKQWMS